MIKCDCKCLYSQHGYCITGEIAMAPLIITGPQGNNEYGMRCSNYVIKDKLEDK